MKQYVVDQLRPADRERLEKTLDETYGRPRFGGVYWIPLPADLLNETQKKHTDCHPLVFALCLSEEKLSCEFLIRTLEKMQCPCMGYADENQASYILSFADELLARHEIIA